MRTFASVSRLHIIAIAALGTFTFGWLFTGERPWLLAAIAAVDWFVVNLLNRVVDLREDQANGIRGTGWVAERRRALTVLGFGLLAASLIVVHRVSPAITPLRLGFHLLGLSYNWPLLPGRRRLIAPSSCWETNPPPGRIAIQYRANCLRACSLIACVRCSSVSVQPASGSSPVTRRLIASF